MRRAVFPVAGGLDRRRSGNAGGGRASDAKKEVSLCMCYTSRDYRAEQEARKAREEARKQREAREARRPEKTEAPKESERELVRA